MRITAWVLTNSTGGFFAAGFVCFGIAVNRVAILCEVYYNVAASFLVSDR